MFEKVAPPGWGVEPRILSLSGPGSDLLAPLWPWQPPPENGARYLWGLQPGGRADDGQGMEGAGWKLVINK